MIAPQSVSGPVRAAEPLADRLSVLGAACLRVNESLDVDTALRAVVDAACSVTGASCGVIRTVDGSGRTLDHLAVGVDSAYLERMWRDPAAVRFFNYVNGVSGPVRAGSVEEFARSVGLAEVPESVGSEAFMAVPMQLRDEHLGQIWLSRSEPGAGFGREDEQMLSLLASQAARAIVNARLHCEERQSRASLETLLEVSPVGVVVYSAAGPEMSFNREARRIAEALRDRGQAPAEMMASLTVRRADGRQVSLGDEPLDYVLASAGTVHAEEVVLEVPDGRSVTVLLNSAPVRSPSGAVESVVTTVQDMTAVNEQERMRAEFLAVVSHELRVPLSSIRGAATAVLDDAADLAPAEVRQFQRIIVQQADHMRGLVGDLLDIARIQTGALAVDPEPADVASLVDRARNAFTAAGGRHDLDLDVAPGLPAVTADRARIVQVLVNLLSNAAAASPQGSTITVAAVAQDGWVEVSVTDRGRGIPAQDLPRLFDRFSRREDRYTPHGAGLGLAICKALVEAHGGRIRAESAGPGLGATLAFTLPTAHDTAAAPRGAQPRSGTPSAGTVLVVDDDPLALRSVRDALTAAGFEAVVTPDPDEATALMAEHNPRLVLVDLMLPGRDGTELMGDLLAISEVPVIFLSAYGRDDTVASVLDKGATDYIVKPFSPTELSARVKAALRRYAQPPRREPFALGELSIDFAQRTVTVAGSPAPLTPTEYDLLAELAAHAGQVVPHDRLLKRVWHPAKPGNMRVLRTHLMRLRRKLGDDAANPKYIVAVPRVGYRMPEADTPA